jgi:hypothetical protein
MGEKRIVEIKGVKMEVDFRNATSIAQYKVGDSIKVLKKQYGNEYKVFSGIIAGFTEFIALPTITIAYLESSYGDAKIEFAHINEKTEDIEIAPAKDFDIPFDKATMMAAMDRKIAVAEETVRDLTMKKEYFLSNFGRYFHHTK